MRFADLLATHLAAIKVRPWCLEHGFSRSNVVKCMSGTRAPNATEATAMADALGLAGTEREAFLVSAADAKVAQEIRSDAALAHFQRMRADLDALRAQAMQRDQQLREVAALLTQLGIEIPASLRPIPQDALRAAEPVARYTPTAPAHPPAPDHGASSVAATDRRTP